jgi:hypothetical protein
MSDLEKTENLTRCFLRAYRVWIFGGGACGRGLRRLLVAMLSNPAQRGDVAICESKASRRENLRKQRRSVWWFASRASAVIAARPKLCCAIRER